MSLQPSAPGDGAEPTKPLRHLLVRDLILLTLLTAGVITGVFVFGAGRALEDLTKQASQHATERVRTELDGFFRPVETALLITSDWAQTSQLDPSQIESMTARFSPVLNRMRQVSSMMVARDDGTEFMLLRRPDGWLTRFSVPGQPSLVQTWDKALRLQTTESKVLDYDPRKRPWFEGAVAIAPKSVAWTQPYTFFTTKEPGITASTRVKGNDRVYVLGFDVLLNDLSEFTTRLRPSPQGTSIVLTTDGRALGLPASDWFDEPEEIQGAVLASVDELPEPTFRKAFARYAEAKDRSGFPIDVDGDRSWVGFEEFALGDTRLLLGAISPESDFVGPAARQRNLALLLTVGVLALAVLLGLANARRFRRMLEARIAEVRKLGQYTLRQRVGEGAMGEVYLASHAMMRRPTAVKLIKPTIADAQMLRHFEREVQATSQLTHPNTVVIYDYGRTPDNVFYYAMEFLAGATLRDIVEVWGPMPPGRVLRFMEQIAGSLAEAHAHGLIHRDVKLANVFVCERGGIFDIAKVLDFGLVKNVNLPEFESEKQAIVGTPGFMAPEVITGQGKVGPAVDIYALGALGYVLATGAMPFVGDSSMGVCMAQLKGDPAPPADLDVGTPDDLSAIIMDCMERIAADRPANMNEVMHRIRGCADYGTWTDELADAWWQQNRDEISALTGEFSEMSATQLTIDIDPRKRRGASELGAETVR